MPRGRPSLSGADQRMARDSASGRAYAGGSEYPKSRSAVAASPNSRCTARNRAGIPPCSRADRAKRSRGSVPRDRGCSSPIVNSFSCESRHSNASSTVGLADRFGEVARLSGVHSTRIGDQTFAITARGHSQLGVGHAEIHGLPDRIVPHSIAHGQPRGGASDLQECRSRGFDRSDPDRPQSLQLGGMLKSFRSGQPRHNRRSSSSDYARSSNHHAR